MYGVRRTKRFERSFKKIKHSGTYKASVESDLEFAIDTLRYGMKLPASYFDHQLSGELSEYRACHIKGDFLLIYERKNDILMLVLFDIGSHSQLFG